MALILALSLVALVPVAEASPPDPVWIEGMYDGAEAKNQLARLSRGIESTRLGFVALARDGRIAMMTDATRRWLHVYFGWRTSSQRLPATLDAWKDRHRVGRLTGGQVPAPAAPFKVNQDHRTLTVRLLVEAGEEVLVLREAPQCFDPAPLEAHGLTRREVEVLGWVIEGKTNPEIALILGLSGRIIHPHLEHVYAKLGVETRAAATARALEAVR